MSKMYCNNCGHFFDSENAKTERFYHSELNGMGGKTYEEYLICPICRDNGIEDAYECEMCGEPTLTEVCDKCKDLFIADLDEFFKSEVKKYNGCDPETLKALAYYELG